MRVAADRPHAHTLAPDASRANDMRTVLQIAHIAVTLECNIHLRTECSGLTFSRLEKAYGRRQVAPARHSHHPANVLPVTQK